MRAIADTNVIVSGLLWHGPSRRVLDSAREGKIVLFTSAELAAELEEVLNREKFYRRLGLANIKPSELVTGYLGLATVVRAPKIAPVVLRDPDDDAVIACAIAADAKYIISGDHDLLELKEYQQIQIVSATEALAELY